jgi:hypothetical protein
MVVGLAVAGGCGHHQDLQKTATQDNFGVQMARMNLWREAMFRFKRAVEINPQDARAHNNLAVAYEANGDFEKARVEYLEALKLDRANQYIQKNYSRFVEFLSRNKKRQAKEAQAIPPKPKESGGRGVTETVAPPTKPIATEPARPTPAPSPIPPSDLPPPPPPAPAPPAPAPSPQPPPGDAL